MAGPQSNQMEQIALFEEKIAITSKDLSRQINSFDELILRKLKLQLEGKCSRDGYVLPNSLELLSRSAPIAEKGRFTGDFLCYLKAQGKVYNPPDGTQVEGDVIRKNKMGIYVVVEDAIRIMIPRDLHIGNEEFDRIELGDRIKIEIKKSRFQVNDTHILSVGQYISSKSASTLVEGSPPALQSVEASSDASGPAEDSASAEEDTESLEEIKEE
jgi:DNA-directed RNA polymerase subunit E'/Rpb7